MELRANKLKNKFSIFDDDPYLVARLNDKIGKNDEDIIDIVNSVDVNGYMMIKYKDGNEWWVYDDKTYEFELESVYRDTLATEGLTGMDDWKDLIDNELLREDVMDTIEHNYYLVENGTEEDWEEIEEGIAEEVNANVFFEADRVMGFHHRNNEKNEIDSYYSQFVTDKTREKYMKENELNLFNAERKIGITDTIAIQTK